MESPQFAVGGHGFQIWKVVANILNKQSRTADKVWSSNWGLGRGLNPTVKRPTCYEILNWTLEFAGSC
jgi:hypothetical protein